MAAIPGLRKERVKSVIICQDREFKAKSVLLLNGAAFPAEKFTVESVEDALDKINNDRTVLNLVIDGSLWSPDDLEKQIRALESGLTNDQLNVLCFLDDAQIDQESRYETLVKHLFIESFPQRQAHFNRAFHSKKFIKQSNILHPPLEGEEEDENQINDSQSLTPNLSIFETSSHLKDTIGMINDLSKNKADIAKVVDIGQRFNGLIGAFHFFGAKEGYPKLRELAEMIDAIGRTYETEVYDEVQDNHLSFLKNAAKCSYLILKDLRDEQAITAEHLVDHEKLADEYSHFEGIKTRHNVDQDSVDELLNSQLSKSS